MSARSGRGQDEAIDTRRTPRDDHLLAQFGRVQQLGEGSLASWTFAVLIARNIS